MRQVMLDGMNLTSDTSRVLVADFSQIGQRSPRFALPRQETTHRVPAETRIGQKVARLRRAVSLRRPRYGDVGDVAQAQAGILQQPPDRVFREGHGVFVALAQPFFRNRADEPAVDDETGRGIGVKGVEAQNGGHACSSGGAGREIVYTCTKIEHFYEIYQS